MTEGAIPGAQSHPGATNGVTHAGTDGPEADGAAESAPIPGSRYGGGSGITIEPTDPADRNVQLWTHFGGFESPILHLPPQTARAIAEDLLARADLIDPATGRDR